MTSNLLSRRTLLKGLGVSMALPFLEGMRPWQASAGPASTTLGLAGRAPIRFAALYMANGALMDQWTPKGTGRDFELSPSLAPLAGFKDDLLVLTNLWHRAANTGDGHYVKTGAWLTGTTITRTTGSNLCAGNSSMDQAIARKIGNLTPLPSLELGIEPVSTGVDVNVGFTRLYGANISYSTPTTPLAKEINPKLAFDRLFRSNVASRTGGYGDDQSVLDLVSEDARRLQRQLGHADRQKLNEYFDSVRAVERRLEFDRKRKAEENLEDPLVRAEIERLGRSVDFYHDPAQVSERGDNHTEQVRLMLDIMALAFWTDSTRVSTFMFGNSVSGRNFSFLEAGLGSHHENSHHEHKAEKKARYRRINEWHAAQCAYFLEKLRGYQEGERSVLDNSMVLFGAGMSDGNAHSPHNLPLILAGRGGGSLSPGRHLVYEKDHPMSNLHVALLKRMGAEPGQWADSTGELAGLSDPV